nr:helix-turn-helix transcriptional regulator [uncultured Dysosmobacter sp.]
MNRLRKIREDRGLRQEDVAAVIGVHFTTISKYELGTSQLTEDLILKFCAYYHVTADYLLGLSNSKWAAVPDSDADVLTAYHAAPMEIRGIVDHALAPYKQAGADRAVS